MQQDHLPMPYALEAFSIAGHRDPFGYWTVTISARRSNSGEWAVVGQYDGLTTDELADVLDAAVDV